MTIKKEYKGIKAFYGRSAAHWRKWLEKNHAKEKSVWLVIYKKGTGVPSITYPEAVDEALCFGWIDSKANTRDEESYYQYFAVRKPKSNWSKVNKEKVAQFIAEGRMAPAGLKSIEVAKANGAWTALDQVEQLIMPDDLKKAFSKNKTALKNWDAFSRSVKWGILEWINSAKTEPTRIKRISETVEKAGRNEKANQYLKTKK